MSPMRPTAQMSVELVPEMSSMFAVNDVGADITLPLKCVSVAPVPPLFTIHTSFSPTDHNFPPVAATAAVHEPSPVRRRRPATDSSRYTVPSGAALTSRTAPDATAPPLSMFQSLPVQT